MRSFVPRWRLATWALVGWTLASLGVALIPMFVDWCSNLSAASRSGCSTGAGFLLGAFWIGTFAIWLIGFLFLALIWVITDERAQAEAEAGHGAPDRPSASMGGRRGSIILGMIGIVIGAWGAYRLVVELRHDALGMALLFGLVAIGGLGLALRAFRRAR